jgi:peptide/nickel transport system substrate-binding protein
LTLGRSLSLEQGIEVQRQWKDGGVGIAFSSWVAVYPQFLNPNPPIVADVRFRKALMYAADRPAMVDAFLSGYSQVADGFLSPRRPEATAIASSVVRYPHDPQRATRLLQEMGYSRGADGKFVRPDGQPLTVPLWTRGGLDIQTKALFTLNDQWVRLGIASEPFVEPLEMDRIERANYPAFEIVRQPNELSVAALLRYHGSQSPLPENNYAGTNRTRYRNPEYDALLDRFTITIEPDLRMGVLGQIIHHMTDQLNIMGLFYDTEVVAHSNRLRQVSPTAKEAGSATTWNAHEWDRS